MADEPILCFDGDDAGRRAAYRALDLALPLLKPGKSLKFATLPDGQDPDDLARSGGREAIEDVLGAARPLGAMLWTRESEAGPFDTPERRAALEARLGEVTRPSATKRCAAITGRISRARLRATVRAGRSRDAPPRRQNFGARALRRQAAGAAARPRPARFRRDAAFGDEPYVAASPQLAASPLHRGHRAAIPRREALILQAALNHPWLLHDHLEELAEAEFRHADTQKLKGALIDVFAHHSAGEFRQDFGHAGEADRAELAAELARRGFAALLGRIERAITTPSVWGARPEAARGRRFADLEAACRLASAMAFPN